MEELVLRTLRVDQVLNAVHQEQIRRPPALPPGTGDPFPQRPDEVLGEHLDRADGHLQIRIRLGECEEPTHGGTQQPFRDAERADGCPVIRACCRTLGGRELTALLSMPIPRSDSGFQHVTLSLLDITERKQAEKQLRLLERAIAASSNGIVISDPTQSENPIIYIINL